MKTVLGREHAKVQLWLCFMVNAVISTGCIIHLGMGHRGQVNKKGFPENRIPLRGLPGQEDIFMGSICEVYTPRAET